MRGLAVLLVVFYHMLLNRNVGTPDFIIDAAQYGQYGVTVFFVISGYIILYALSQANYSTKDLPRFLFRRIVRIEPPYLCAVLFSIALMYVSTLAPIYKGEPFELDMKQALLHIAYIIPLSEKNWISGVYWTLCVEFQFYILIAAAYSTMIAAPRLTIVLLVLSPLLFVDKLLPSEQLPLGEGREFIVLHLPVFMMGALLYLRETDTIDTVWFGALLALAAIIAALTQPLAVAGFALLGVFGISALRRPPRLLLAFGTISYSMYLLHAVVIMKSQNLLARLNLDWFVINVLALIAALVTAFLLWFLVEKPSIRASKYFKTHLVKVRPRSDPVG